MNKKKLPAARKYILFLLIFFLLIFIFKATGDFNKQKAVNLLLENAGYPEVKDKKPEFEIEIKTGDSSTHIISFLSGELLRVGDFDAEAARKVTVYVEEIGKNKDIFYFNPFIKGGSGINVQLLPSYSKLRTNYVILISEKDPVPAILTKQQDDLPFFKRASKQNGTFSATVPVPSGMTTFIRYSEPVTWKYGLPSRTGQELTPREQLNIIFNIEIWKRSIVVQLVDTKIGPVQKKETIINARESIWNTFGQLVAAKQENVPENLMQERLQNRVLVRKMNRAYYPFDEKARRIYENAPQYPIIR